MNTIPKPWKIFRLTCNIQLITLIVPMLFHLIMLFMGRSIFLNSIIIVCYLLLLLFTYLGLNILSNNFPDKPLDTTKKRRFNILFLINFLLITFLFYKIADNWWLFQAFFFGLPSSITMFGGFLITIAFTSILSFILHLLILYGMFSLRRLIHQNAEQTWASQFSEENTRQI